MANYGIGMGPQPMKDNMSDSRALLNTYIHNYLVNEGHNDVAKALRNSNVPTVADKLKKEGQNQVNGADGSMDTDSKDDKRGSDAFGDMFLLDYWFIFWDMWAASKARDNKQETVAGNYLMHSQMQRPMFQQPMMSAGVPNGYRGMMPGAQVNLQKNAVNNNAQRNMNQFGRMPLGQQPMQREGSDMDGNQRPQSPMSGGENAPSPSKRQRTEGTFNGQQMMMNRNNSQLMYSQGVANQTRSAMTQFQNGGFPMAGGPGMSPMTADNPAYDMGMSNPMRGSVAGGNGGALADYQMQLMLLEQQNKKRLMMARQEQDVHHNAAIMGQPGYPQNTSPQGRNGQSPNGNDTKRNTPKMNQGSPLPDGMPNRNSPIPPGFDPNQMGMAQQFQPPMGKMMGDGLMGNMRPPNAHPMNPQMEMMQQRAGGRMPNGNWVGGPMPAQMLTQGPPGPGQPENPQQRNNMPPPQVPPANKTQPSPTQSNAAPPTPSQTNKPAPKKKDTKDSKRKAPKKAQAAANAAAAEPERPPTPTPQTPATPIAPESHLIKGQPGQPAGGINGPVPSVASQMPSNVGQGNNSMEPFGNIGAVDSQNDFDISHFGFMDNGAMGNEDPSDILGGFDFDTFLDPTGSSTWETEFAMPGDGLETGAGP